MLAVFDGYLKASSQGEDFAARTAARTKLVDVFDTDDSGRGRLGGAFEAKSLRSKDTDPWSSMKDDSLLGKAGGAP